jgi:hypothetical protein
VKNTAYFDIAAYPLSTSASLRIAESAAGWRLFAQDSTDKPARSSGRDAREGNGPSAYVLIQAEVGKKAQVPQALRAIEGVQWVDAIAGPDDTPPGLRRQGWSSWACWSSPASKPWPSSPAP